LVLQGVYNFYPTGDDPVLTDSYQDIDCGIDIDSNNIIYTLVRAQDSTFEDYLLLTIFNTSISVLSAYRIRIYQSTFPFPNIRLKNLFGDSKTSVIVKNGTLYLSSNALTPDQSSSFQFIFKMNSANIPTGQVTVGNYNVSIDSVSMTVATATGYTEGAVSGITTSLRTSAYSVSTNSAPTILTTQPNPTITKNTLP
jgi:hypothetical protein